MAKKTPKQKVPEEGFERIDAPGALRPDQKAYFTCHHCQAEFAVINEPGKPPSFPSREPLFCPFCGDDHIIKT